jgi:CMP-N-acetylneuraminic acid synthetase
MKVTAFIPMKLNNERTPGKNTKPFSDGTPLCHFVQKALLQVPEVDEIVAFCSDERIKDYLLPGVKFLKRPTSLDTKETLCGDIIRTFLEMHKADIYVMSHATSPFIKPERFSQCINAVKSHQYDSAFACKKLSNFIWYQGKPLNFRLDKAPRTQDMEAAYCELSTPYVFTPHVFETYHGRSGENPFMCECSEIESIDVDYPEDFALADMVYTHLLKENNHD